MSALREATLAVVRAALAGGHLTPDELRLALLVQERLGTCDDPALVLPLLRWKFLPAESLPSLTGVYKRTVAASRGPAPPPPVLQPSQREQAGELLEQGDELLLTHPDLDPPDVQAFLLEADAARFSDPPPSARLGQIPDPSSTARVLEESDEGALELGLDTSLSDVLADSDLPHAASSSGGSGELFEESDEGPLELVSSSVEAPAAPRFESEDASDIPSDASDIPSDASSDLLEIDAWSDAPEAEPLDDSSDAPTTPPAGADWGT